MGEFTFNGLNLRKLISDALDPTSGHDHDGVNSMSVTNGTTAAPPLSIIQITYSLSAAA